MLILGSKRISRLSFPGMRVSSAQPIGSCIRPAPPPTPAGTFCFNHDVLKRAWGWIPGKKNVPTSPLSLGGCENEFVCRVSTTSLWDSAAKCNPLWDVCVQVARELSSLPDRQLVLDLLVWGWIWASQVCFSPLPSKGSMESVVQ